MKRESIRRQATPDDVILGGKIKARRLELGLSQAEVGRPLGVSFQQVQKYERGVNRIAAGRLTAIAEILDVPLSFFYEATDPLRQPSRHVTLDAETERVVQTFLRIKSRKIRSQLVVLAERLADKQG